jgi:hypothetical protein
MLRNHTLISAVYLMSATNTRREYCQLISEYYKDGLMTSAELGIMGKTLLLMADTTELPIK